MKQISKMDFPPLRGTLRLVLGIGLFFFVLSFPSAAEIVLENVEMASRGKAVDEKFQLSSVISADIALTGGYKYAFLLGLSLDGSNGLNYREPPVPFFRVAKATARDIFDRPLELSYYYGAGDDFCTGEEFDSRFGLSPFGTEFKGFFYFPDGIRYDGVYGVRGTGISLALTKWEKIVPIAYLYQNFAETGNVFDSENFYSGDLRLLFSHEELRLETFGGVSWNSDMEKSVRGGLMFHFAGEGVEFFAQGGVPGWVTENKFSIDNMFFLIEPRLRFDLFSLFLTFFYHPAEYLNLPTDEQGWADINVKFQFGRIDSGMAGGIEAGGGIRNEGLDDFILRIAPFGTFVSGGLRWDAKLVFKPLEFATPEELLEIFIGVRTAF